MLRPRHLLALASAIALASCASTEHAHAPRSAIDAVSAEAAPVASRAKQMLPPWTNAAPSGPGQRVLATAARMIDEGTIIRGSCYGYIDAIFDEAGYSGWRRRERVFRGRTSGPYVELDRIQPGDWLWIVNHPELTPVGTHSVLFVEWEDRERSLARVVSYVGGRRERPGDYVVYDVSRTYAVQRAVEAEPRQSRRPR